MISLLFSPFVSSGDGLPYQRGITKPFHLIHTPFVMKQENEGKEHIGGFGVYVKKIKGSSHALNGLEEEGDNKKCQFT